MSEVNLPVYTRYEVTLTRWQAFKTLLRPRVLGLTSKEVRPVVTFGTGVSRVRVTCFGAGGGGEYAPEPRTYTVGSRGGAGEPYTVQEGSSEIHIIGGGGSGDTRRD